MVSWGKAWLQRQQGTSWAPRQLWAAVGLPCTEVGSETGCWEVATS